LAVYSLHEAIDHPEELALILPIVDHTQPLERRKMTLVMSFSVVTRRDVLTDNFCNRWHVPCPVIKDYIKDKKKRQITRRINAIMKMTQPFTKAGS